MKLLFDVCYLPFTIATIDDEPQVVEVGVPFIVQYERHFWELMSDPSGAPGRYWLALWAVLHAGCDLQHSPGMRPMGYIGPAWSLPGYRPFSVPDMMPRRLFRKLYWRLAERAAQDIWVERKLARADARKQYAHADPQVLEALIEKMFSPQNMAGCAYPAAHLPTRGRHHRPYGA